MARFVLKTEDHVKFEPHTRLCERKLKSLCDAERVNFLVNKCFYCNQSLTKGVCIEIQEKQQSEILLRR